MECTATCGGGVTLRTRRPNTCTNSLSCKGPFIEQQICNTESCPEFSTLSTDVAHLKRDGRYQLTFDYYFQGVVGILCQNLYNILVSAVDGKVTSNGKSLQTTWKLATQNRQRHANTDSSLGMMCSLMDEIFGAGISGLKARSCCFVSHTETVVGNYFSCMDNTWLSIGNFFKQLTAGTCDTSTAYCGTAAETLLDCPLSGIDYDQCTLP